MIRFLSDIRNSALALVAWSVAVLWLLYATRLPAMARARISLKRIAVKNSESFREEQKKMPLEALQVAENYNHLMEQPTIFYALVFFVASKAGEQPGLAARLNAEAWAYVLLRVAHSLVQCFYNTVALRFAVFALSSLVLTHMVCVAVANEIF